MANTLNSFLSYFFAVLSSFVLLIFKLFALRDHARAAPFLLLIIAPIISALLGGIGPGLVALILTTILLKYFLLPPYHSFSMNEDIFLQLLLYFLQGLLIVWLIDRQRKTNERNSRLAAIVDSSDDAIYGKTLEGTITSWNKGAEKMYGYKPEEIIGKKVLTLAPRDRKSEIPRILQQLRQGKSIDHHETERLTKDGRIIDVSVSISPVRSRGGQPIGASTIARDITERKRLDAELQRSKRELEMRVRDRTKELKELNKEFERSNRELQDFASVASHDLQEPLRKIQAFGDRLKMKGGSLSDEGKDYLERMLHAAGRMRKLIDDLLTFSRVTSRAQPFTKVDLTLITEEVLSDLETLIEKTKGKVIVENLPVIEADPTQMRQILQNLISNGLKFHKDDEPPIIKMYSMREKTKKNNQKVRIFIEDNGIGFEERYLDKIFTVFQRLHGRSEYEGTGVGLAVVRKIVERHDGSITAKSEPGKGATFIITLPIEHEKGGVENE